MANKQGTDNKLLVFSRCHLARLLVFTRVSKPRPRGQMWRAEILNVDHSKTIPPSLWISLVILRICLEYILNVNLFRFEL